MIYSESLTVGLLNSHAHRILKALASLVNILIWVSLNNVHFHAMVRNCFIIWWLKQLSIAIISHHHSPSLSLRINGGRIIH